MECTICYSLLSEGADCEAPKSAKRANGVAKGQGQGQLCCLPCGHIFHKYCVLNWMEMNKNGTCLCPICRRVLKETRQLKDVFLPTVDKVGELMKKNDKLEEEVKGLKKEVEGLKKKVKEGEEEDKEIKKEVEVREKKVKEEDDKVEKKEGNGQEEKDEEAGDGKMDFLAAWNKWRSKPSN